ncbi:class A beta-lactamase [Terribacillus sp. 7520-G]|uniref:class A beta-lactamase n=1 Tax=Terribacillus TaxID=459532 RepID=UPI000BA65901|nr:class A beta-lactamase [Terribacillus sp. 7520-G]PAD38664.1 class A beta-lactamase [Terribacillus sp. 7520-G]
MKISTCLFSALFAFCLLAGCSSSTNEGSDTSSSVQAAEDAQEPFADLEKAYDAHLGVYAIDTGSGKTAAYRENERFGFASTHKALSAAVLLQQNSLKDLDKKIMYTRDDLVNYNPITEKHIDSGMTLKELGEASVSYSDNTAANLIFEEIGGPDGLKQALRDIGDQVTEPSRIEPELNNVKPGETQDTSTPKALAESLRAFTLGDSLPAEKRQLLIDWLKGNTTGDALIKAGVPEEWEVGDKTGAGAYGTRNDIAVLWPPDSDPIIMAVMSSRDEADAKYDDALIAKAAEEAVSILSAEE